MPIHDEYGKGLFRPLLGDRWSSLDFARSVQEEGVRADLDGIIRRADDKSVECTVEIEARVYKQIRGAMVDLSLHPAPQKLLVVIKAQPQLGDTPRIMRHCTYIWQQVAGTNRGEFEMAVLEGTGLNPNTEFDLKLLKDTLQKLGIATTPSV